MKPPSKVKSRPGAGRLFLVLVALWRFTASAGAQGTAFTYQGLLQADGRPVGGVFDLRFTACDAVTNGNVVGGPVTNAAVWVTNGLVTTMVDLGAGVFAGPAVWLQVEVRTNGASGFTPLFPRQPVTAAPYAILAGSAVTASNVPGAVTAAQLPALYAAAVVLSNVQPVDVLTGAGVASVNGTYAPFDWSDLVNGNTTDTNGVLMYGGGATNGGLTAYPLEIDDPSGLTNYYYCNDTNGLVWFASTPAFNPPPTGTVSTYFFQTNVGAHLGPNPSNDVQQIVRSDLAQALTNFSAIPLYGYQNDFQLAPPLGVGAIAGNGWTNCLARMAGMRTNGLYAAGYHWLFSDVGWCKADPGTTFPVLDAEGFVQWDPKLWPLGNATAQVIHDSGFKFEVWEDAIEQWLDLGHAVANFNHLATVIGADQIWLDDGPNGNFLKMAATALATNGANCALSAGVSYPVPAWVPEFSQNLIVHDLQGDAVNWTNGLAWLDHIATNQLERYIRPGHWISMNGEGGAPGGGNTVDSLLGFQVLKCLYDMPIWITSDYADNPGFLRVYTNMDLLNIDRDIGQARRFAITNGCWWYLKQSAQDSARYYLAVLNTNPSAVNVTIALPNLPIPAVSYAVYDDVNHVTVPSAGGVAATIPGGSAVCYTLYPVAAVYASNLITAFNVSGAGNLTLTTNAAGIAVNLAVPNQTPAITVTGPLTVSGVTNSSGVATYTLGASLPPYPGGVVTNLHVDLTRCLVQLSATVPGVVTTNAAFAFYGPPAWNFPWADTGWSTNAPAAFNGAGIGAGPMFPFNAAAAPDLIQIPLPRAVTNLTATFSFYTLIPTNTWTNISFVPVYWPRGRAGPIVAVSTNTPTFTTSTNLDVQTDVTVTNLWWPDTNCVKRLAVVRNGSPFPPGTLFLLDVYGTLACGTNGPAY